MLAFPLSPWAARLGSRSAWTSQGTPHRGHPTEDTPQGTEDHRGHDAGDTVVQLWKRRGCLPGILNMHRGATRDPCPQHSRTPPCQGGRGELRRRRAVGGGEGGRRSTGPRSSPRAGGVTRKCAVTVWQQAQPRLGASLCRWVGPGLWAVLFQASASLTLSGQCHRTEHTAAECS